MDVRVYGLEIFLRSKMPFTDDKFVGSITECATYQIFFDFELFFISRHKLCWRFSKKKAVPLIYLRYT